MYKGITEFKCDECGHRFSAPNFEYAATAYTIPQPCPKCGSRHTMPPTINPFTRHSYRQIWKSLDNHE